MLNLFRSQKDFDTAVSGTAMEYCEEVISQMGAEIHDDLIQRLTILRLYLDRLERSHADPAEVASVIAAMQADFQQVVESVRKISRQLLPMKFENDSFQKGIHLLCQNLERPGAGTIHFNSVGPDCTLQPPADLHLYRIAQELIHNAIRHSAAWHVWVSVQHRVNSILVEVEDDGTGFSKITDAISALNRKQNTLRMRSRIIGARIEYLQGERGLLARVEMPIHK
ncbi:MAG: hypothetical protein JST46_02900 [Bacteroidetes bacterium]|nr:hypothetical protein [Bacteroidota bacterium]